MPYKKPYRKKPIRRKRVYRKKNMTNRLTLARPKVYPFSRNAEHLLALDNVSGGWISTLDGAVVKTFNFTLAQLGTKYTDFTNLFSQYKLNMAIVKFYPSSSQVVISTGPSGTQNMIITIWPNTHGVPIDATFTHAQLLEIQRKKTFMFPLNRPTSVKMYLKQLSNTYVGTSGAYVDYTTTRPRYLSTGEINTPHYGMNVHIRKMDGTTFGTNAPRLLIREKVYLTCKQVS